MAQLNELLQGAVNSKNSIRDSFGLGNIKFSEYENALRNYFNNKPAQLVDYSNLNSEDASALNVVLDEKIISKFQETSSMQFNNVEVNDIELFERYYIKANESISLNETTVNAQSDSTNHGAVNFTAKSLNLNNVEIGGSAYNVFEGSQTPNNPESLVKSIVIENTNNTDASKLTHNIVNIYTPDENSEIIIKDSSFVVNPDTSNILRLSNYANKSGVKILFENVNVTYDPSTGYSPNYAGFVLIQKAGDDNGSYEGWELTFKNCTLNGEAVTANNFGQANQIVYCYINKQCIDPESLNITLNFE